MFAWKKIQKMFLLKTCPQDKIILLWLVCLRVGGGVILVFFLFDHNDSLSNIYSSLWNVFGEIIQYGAIWNWCMLWEAQITDFNIQTIWFNFLECLIKYFYSRQLTLNMTPWLTEILCFALGTGIGYVQNKTALSVISTKMKECLASQFHSVLAFI